MVGFISGIPTKISICGTEIEMVKINFLCVKKEFRNHRLSTVLIQEITRRIHLKNIWQATYSSYTLIPKPFSRCTYYYRNINVKKLSEIKFTQFPFNMSLGKAIKYYDLPEEQQISGFRLMEEKDVEQVYNLLMTHQMNFKVFEIYSKEEVSYWLLPRKNFIYSYVLENEKKNITDFISFYSLPSSVLKNDKHKKLSAAFSFFNINTSISLKDLMKTALVLAKQLNFDVFNCLNIMENEKVFKELLFCEKEGKLKYYLYNFVCPDTEAKDISLLFM